MLNKQNLRRYAVEMIGIEDTPESYLQFIEEIATEVPLYDIIDEWLVITTEGERDLLINILNNKGFLGEQMDVLELPLTPTPLLEDYGLISLDGKVFLWEKNVALFFWEHKNTTPDAGAAYEQISEDLVASFTLHEPSIEILVVPGHLKKLIYGTAEAYQIKISEVE